MPLLVGVAWSVGSTGAARDAGPADVGFARGAVHTPCPAVHAGSISAMSAPRIPQWQASIARYAPGAPSAWLRFMWALAFPPAAGRLASEPSSTTMTLWSLTVTASCCIRPSRFALEVRRSFLALAVASPFPLPRAGLHCGACVPWASFRRRALVPGAVAGPTGIAAGPWVPAASAKPNATERAKCDHRPSPYRGGIPRHSPRSGASCAPVAAASQNVTGTSFPISHPSHSPSAASIAVASACSRLAASTTTVLYSYRRHAQRTVQGWLVCIVTPSRRIASGELFTRRGLRGRDSGRPAHSEHAPLGASILNTQGRRTAHGLPFTKDLVYNLRRYHGIPAHHVLPNEQSDTVPLSVADAARELAVNEATLYRWIHAGLVPVIHPSVDGAPLRVNMTVALRARFRAQPPEGFVPVQIAMQRLGVSRQTIWNRVRAGALASCQVTHGRKRGLYVQMADEETLSLFEPPPAVLPA